MRRIRGKDTAPELIVRKALHAAGLRFRNHAKGLPGRPDLVLSQYGTAVFVNGCFWHSHEGCPAHQIPKTSRKFWLEKLQRNVERDELNQLTLVAAGWKVLVIWECALRGKRKLQLQEVVERATAFLNNPSCPHEEVSGAGILS